MKHYALKAAGLTIALYVVGIILYYSFPDKNIIHDVSWVLIIGVFFISVSAELITLIGLKKEKINLVPFLLGTMITRLLLGIIILTVFLLLTKNDRILLAINFLVIYFCFMVFEINSSIANLRQFFEKGTDNEQISL